MLMDDCLTNTEVASLTCPQQAVIKRTREPQRQGTECNYRQHHRATPGSCPLLQNHEDQHFNRAADQHGLKQGR
jgi:hypothetical protein